MVYYLAVSLRLVRMYTHALRAVRSERKITWPKPQASKPKSGTTRRLPRSKPKASWRKTPSTTSRCVDAGDGLDDDKLESPLSDDSDDEDLLEGIPEEELKATVEVQLPRWRARARCAPCASAMPTQRDHAHGRPRPHVPQGDRQGPAAHGRRRDRPRHEDRGRRGRHGGA